MGDNLVDFNTINKLVGDLRSQLMMGMVIGGINHELVDFTKFIEHLIKHIN